MKTIPIDLRCPFCGSRLRRGKASVHGTFFGFLVFGLSSQHLWWHGPNGEKEREIASGGNRPGLRCPDCGAVVVAPRGYRHGVDESP